MANYSGSDVVIYHHGILGQKWGVRRFQNKDGSLTSLGKKRKTSSENSESESSEESKKSSSTSSQSSKKSLSEMTDQEIQERINRINLEKKYKELTSPSEVKKVNRGAKFISDVLENSAKNIATQTATYLMGKGVNKLLKNVFGEDVVNPKKGQKDK